MADSGRWRVRLSCLWLSFPLCGNGLSKPLDSSAALFQTPLYHLHPCRRACAGMTEELSSGCYRNDGVAGFQLAPA